MKNFGKILLFILILAAGDLDFAIGQELELNSGLPLNLNPLDVLNSAGIKGVDLGSGEFLKGLKFGLPIFPPDLKFNINTNIPLSPKLNESQQTFPAGFSPGDINLKQFLTPKDISSNDLAKAAKAIITLVIEIFLTVISIVSQILKLILEFLR